MASVSKKPSKAMRTALKQKQSNNAFGAGPTRSQSSLKTLLQAASEEQPPPDGQAAGLGQEKEGQLQSNEQARGDSPVPPEASVAPAAAAPRPAQAVLPAPAQPPSQGHSRIALQGD